MNIILSVVVITIGMVVGDLAGFFIGRYSHSLMKKEHRNIITRKVDYLSNKYPGLLPVILFVYVSFVPLPNEVIVIPLGLARVKLRSILPALLLGSLLFNSLAGAGILNIYSLIFGR